MENKKYTIEEIEKMMHEVIDKELLSDYKSMLIAMYLEKLRKENNKKSC